MIMALGGSLEDNVLTALCWSEKLAPRIALRLTADDFSTVPYKAIAAAALDFLESHHRPGRGHIADIMEHEIRHGGRDGEFILSVLVEMEQRLWPLLNEEYVCAEFDKFVAIQRLTASVTKAGELLHNGNLAEARNMLARSAVKAARSVGSQTACTPPASMRENSSSMLTSLSNRWALR